MSDGQKTEEEAPAPGGAKRIQCDDKSMRSTYANVVNVTSTREEVMLLFGTNQTSMVGGVRDVTVQLSDRLILNPYVAKRLAVILGGVLKEYESRFGELRLEAIGVRPDS